MSKDNIILMRAGRETKVNLPSHELNTAGYSTFTISSTDFDLTKPLQWSVIGARKSEILPSTNTTAQCRVYVLPDQYNDTDEDRIVNVSVAGSAASTGVAVEATAVLTVKIHATQAVPDFEITAVDFPEVIQYTLPSTGASTITPTKLEVKAHLSARVGSPASPKFTGYVTFDVQGDYSHTETYQLEIPAGETNGTTLVADITDALHGRIDANMGNREFLEGSIDVDVFRHAEGSDPDYYHIRGRKFLVHKASPVVTARVKSIREIKLWQ